MQEELDLSCVCFFAEGMRVPVNEKMERIKRFIVEFVLGGGV